jgi:hypothetical protein
MMVSPQKTEQGSLTRLSAGVRLEVDALWNVGDRLRCVGAYMRKTMSGESGMEVR